jgi:hypothetical protein
MGSHCYISRIWCFSLFSLLTKRVFLTNHHGLACFNFFCIVRLLLLSRKPYFEQFLVQHHACLQYSSSGRFICQYGPDGGFMNNNATLMSMLECLFHTE